MNTVLEEATVCSVVHIVGLPFVDNPHVQKGSDLRTTLCIIIAILYTSAFSEPFNIGFGVRRCSGALKSKSEKSRKMG